MHTRAALSSSPSPPSPPEQKPTDSRVALLIALSNTLILFNYTMISVFGYVVLKLLTTIQHFLTSEPSVKISHPMQLPEFLWRDRRQYSR